MHVDHPQAARLAVLIADELNSAAVHDPGVVRAMVNIMCRRLGQNPSAGEPALLTQMTTWQRQGALTRTSFDILTLQVKAFGDASRQT